MSWHLSCWQYWIIDVESNNTYESLYDCDFHFVFRSFSRAISLSCSLVLFYSSFLECFPIDLNLLCAFDLHFPCDNNIISFNLYTMCHVRNLVRKHKIKITTKFTNKLIKANIHVILCFCIKLIALGTFLRNAREYIKCVWVYFDDDQTNSQLLVQCAHLQIHCASLICLIICIECWQRKSQKIERNGVPDWTNEWHTMLRWTYITCFFIS